MTLTHLRPMLPGFLAELRKEAGIKEDLKAGTKKVFTALKAVPQMADEHSARALLKLRHTGKIGEKIVHEGPEVIRRMLT